MSFNPTMTLLARAAVELLPPRPTVIELGNQTFNADDAALRHVVGSAARRSDFDHDGLTSLLGATSKDRKGKTEAYYRCLGFADYQAIDVNATYGSLIMDLNRDLEADYDFKETFMLVTNNGTGEHIFNQASVFRNIHRLAKPGGLMLHLLPFMNYVNHGFYCFHPNLFHALAHRNGYGLEALGIANRYGAGVLFTPPDQGTDFAALLPDMKPVELGTLLSDVKNTRQTGWQGFKKRLKRIGREPKPGERFNESITRLQEADKNLLVFALLRKQSEEAFELPIQGLYAEAIDDSQLRTDYSAPKAAATAP